jgi:hypothetical protein
LPEKHSTFVNGASDISQTTWKISD